jgi:hypothetical protein
MGSEKKTVTRQVGADGVTQAPPLKKLSGTQQIASQSSGSKQPVGDGTDTASGKKPKPGA